MTTSASTLAVGLFLLFNSLLALLHVVTLRAPELAAWIDWGIGLDFNGPTTRGLFGSAEVPAVLAASLSTSIGCAIAYFLASERLTLVLSLTICHVAAFFTTSSGRLAILWSTKHGVASIVALLITWIVTLLRVCHKLWRWRVGLQAFEKFAEHLPPPPSDDSIPGVDGPVLILYANVGSGHKRAAKAVEAALLKRGAPADKVVLLDAMELCGGGFRFMMQTMFQELTQSLAGQHLLGYLYDAQDGGRYKSRLQRSVENLCMLDLLERVAELQPALCLCTHFLPAQLLAGLRRRSHVLARNLPLAIVLTDLDLQSMWVQQVDAYFLPRDDAATLLMQCPDPHAQSPGSPLRAKLTVSGIPIMPAFSAVADDARSTDAKRVKATRAAAHDAFGLPAPGSDALPTVLLMSSGAAVVVAAYTQLLKCETPLRVLVVMGRQADVRAELEAVDVPARHAAHFYGFVTDMPGLMRATDLLVCKSGGLTIAEAAALGVPLLILDPIPGQETRNADVVLEAGAAVRVNDLPLLPSRVNQLLRDKGARLDVMRRAMLALGKPDAAYTIADAILQRRVVPVAALEDKAAAEAGDTAMDGTKEKRA